MTQEEIEAQVLQAVRDAFADAKKHGRELEAGVNFDTERHHQTGRFIRTGVRITLTPNWPYELDLKR